jgi:hypothetical protein
MDLFAVLDHVQEQLQRRARSLRRQYDPDGLFHGHFSVR